MSGARTHENKLTYISFFGSIGTLLCCVLPSLLVLAGLGTAVASILGSFPWFVALSRHKAVVFTIAGLLIAFNFVYVYNIVPKLKSAAQACDPSDDACRTASRMSRVVLWTSALLYAVGFFTAFLLGPILAHFE